MGVGIFSRETSDRTKGEWPQVTTGEIQVECKEQLLLQKSVEVLGSPFQLYHSHVTKENSEVDKQNFVVISNCFSYIFTSSSFLTCLHGGNGLAYLTLCNYASYSILSANVIVELVRNIHNMQGGL